MAATSNLAQLPARRNSPINKTGVLTTYGFGIHVRMQSGHLEIEDGMGLDRRKFRLPRVGHGLKRLVCIGSDGLVSLSALRWLADQDAAFVMLDRDGTVLCTTGPVRPSDARLRRAQALAPQTGINVTIARELISQKLSGQERVARQKLHDDTTGQQIADFRLELAEAETLSAIRSLESRGAAVYWSAWRHVGISFPTRDLPRVPEHWRSFGTRKSPLSGSPRLAANPANAILNYLYAVLESEARLASAALGLDPGLGFIHVDTPARDSLACDLMEAVRPSVDAWLLDWISREPFRRSDFFEQPNGNCRILKNLTTKLSETAPTWGKLVAPWAEFVARTLWNASRTRETAPTHLTQQHRREAKGSSAISDIMLPRADRLCRGCGKTIRAGRNHCGNCAIVSATERLIDAARKGRVIAHRADARAKQGRTQRGHAKLRSAWKVTGHSAPLTEEAYSEAIQPLLADMPTSAIANAMGVSRWYAGRVRQGHCPHPRHWEALREIVKVTSQP